MKNQRSKAAKTIITSFDSLGGRAHFWLLFRGVEPILAIFKDVENNFLGTRISPPPLENTIIDASVNFKSNINQIKKGIFLLFTVSLT